MNFKKFYNHNELYEFYKQNKLEVSLDILKEDGAVLSLINDGDEEVLAAATLSKREGYFILDYVAVSDALRGNGLGKKLVFEMIQNAKNLGADDVFISAKNYGFFKAIGFKEGAPKNLDLNKDCKGCSQYLKECKPVVMKIDIWGCFYDERTIYKA